MSLAFQGRLRELDALQQGLQAVARGGARAFALVGEPGIGKTRLAVEAAQHATALGFTALWGPSWETGGAPAYWPWRSLLSARPGTAALALLRGERSASSSDPDLARFELFETVCAELRAASAQGPLLCVLDDLHAADLPTLELAAFAIGSLRGCAIAWLFTWRGADAERGPARDALARLARDTTVLPLTALSLGETGELASSILGATLPAFRQALFTATGGNPLFVVETARTLASRGGEPLAEALDRLPLAQGVSAMALARTRLLSAESRAALEAASVIGREIDLLLWTRAAAAAPHDVRAWAAEATGAGVLLETRSDHWVFSHALVRDATYTSLGPERRRALHLRIATELEPGSLARAHHELSAHPLCPTDTVVLSCVAAADRARAQCACEEAVGVLERAQALAPRDGELLIALGWAHSDLGHAAEAKALFGAAMEAARGRRDASMLARAVLGYGSRYLLGDVRTDLLPLIEEAAGALGDSDAGLRSRLQARRAAALTPAERPLEVLAMAREAIAGSKGCDARTRLEVTVSAGSALGDFAPDKERLALSADLVLLSRECGDRSLELRGLSRLFTDCLAAGDIARADVVLTERDALARALKLPRLNWSTPLFHSMRAMPAGRFSECHAWAREAEALAAATGDSNARRTLAVHRFWLALLEDDVQGLPGRSAEALGQLLTMPAELAAAVRAVTAARMGDSAAAKDAVQVFDVELKACATNTLATLAEVFAVHANDAVCAAAYERLLPHLESTAVWGLFGFTCGPPVAASAGLLAARLGKRTLAAEHFDAALARARSMNATAHEAWAQRWRGQPSERRPAPTLPLEWSLRRQGNGWAVERAGRSFLLPELRGLEMLARLVETPDLEVHALELTGGGAIESGDAGEHLDETARADYRRRAGALSEALEDAEERGNIEAAERAREELDAIAKELSRAVGLGGRVRKAGASAERARVSANRRIREAIRRIADEDQELGAHLEQAVRTGLFCAYEPRRRQRHNL